MDNALTAIAPRKESKHRIQTPIPTVDREGELWVVSFDGSDRVKRGGGTFSSIVPSLPGRRVVSARSGYIENFTVNETEYNGLLLELVMLGDLDRKRLVICGDSNLVIQQVRGEIDRKAPGLTLLKRKVLDRLSQWSDHEIVRGGPEHQQQVTLNRLDEILIPETEKPVVRVAAVTTRSSRVMSPVGVMQEDQAREMRVDRVRQAPEEEVWITGMKKYLSGSIADLTQADARSYGKSAADYEVDEQDLLFYCPPTPRSGDDRDRLMRLVVPETLQSDVLHHYHATLEGGHQGVGRTYQRIRDHSHWRGLYRSVQRYVGECVDCETGKG
ncbi:reverse transcriptase [Phytophthora megakarya]|uniref:Reverse transcriptase n=1 Tax=Phytophthora megakarya TaxID=4795 RepID=A0A225VBT3_9STRA|nr:reverse transcriptase [Phytophthora megakarya]